MRQEAHLHLSSRSSRPGEKTIHFQPALLSDKNQYVTYKEISD